MVIRESHIGLTILLLTTVVTFSCRRTQPAPPPQPPPPTTAPAPPSPAPAITLRAEPTTIERGQSVTLQWDARNAGTVRIEPGVGEVSTSGNRQVSPTSSVTYTATATGPGGTSTDTARITVNAPAPPVERPPAPRTTPAPTEAELFDRDVKDIYFDYDQAEIRGDQISQLQRNAAVLKEHPNLRFTIEGHADERGSQEYNLGLGDRRANAVRQFLASQGISESRMNIVSYGEERPDCREETEACFQRNRRAAFTLNP